MTKALAFGFFEDVMEQPLAHIPPRAVGGWRVVEILWPLNDIFRPFLARLRTLPYESRFEPEADQAIEAFATAPVAATWQAVSPGAWRVLLERHQQMIMVGLANDRARQPVTYLPDGLPVSAELPGLLLLCLHGMKLPWSPETFGISDFPAGPVPTSLKLH